MNRPTHPADSEYDRLASPLKNAGQFIEAEQEELLSEERTILEGTSFKRRESRPPRRGTQTIRVGELTIIAGKTTPVLSCNSAAGFSCFMAMPFIGGFTTSDGPLYDEVSAGDIYFNQSYYGTSTIGYLSSLFFALDRKRLDRAMRTISGGESCNALATSLIIRDGRCSRSKKKGGGQAVVTDLMDRSALWRIHLHALLPRSG